MISPMRDPSDSFGWLKWQDKRVEKPQELRKLIDKIRFASNMTLIAWLPEIFFHLDLMAFFGDFIRENIRIFCSSSEGARPELAQYCVIMNEPERGRLHLRSGSRVGALWLQGDLDKGGFELNN